MTYNLMYTYIRAWMEYIFFLSAICFFIAHFCGDLFSVFKHHTRTHRTKHILYTHILFIQHVYCIWCSSGNCSSLFAFLSDQDSFWASHILQNTPPSLSFVLIFVFFFLLFFFPLLLFCSFFSLSFFYCVCRACFVVYSTTTSTRYDSSSISIVLIPSWELRLFGLLWFTGFSTLVCSPVWWGHRICIFHLSS